MVTYQDRRMGARDKQCGLATEIEICESAGQW